MNNDSAALDDRQTLEQVLESRGVPTRDCRDCSKFGADPQGRSFGWCEAHACYVKLYQAGVDWHSQCQFKTLRLVRELRVEPAVPEVGG
jgi:hypothetical protein